MMKLTEQEQRAVNQIVALRNYTDRSGFRTTRAETAIMAGREGETLANVLMALEEMEEL